MTARIGIDIGSTATKVAVLEGDELAGTLLLPTGFNSAEVAARVKDELAQRGYAPGNSRMVATGYGRVAVPYADRTVTEITCHGRGAAYLFGPDGVVVDVGGQDTKTIRLVGGRVVKFLMNDKCAAGTGKFLEVMANRMGVTQDELADLARAGRPAPISNMCTVFAESEVISLVGQGEPAENIASGVIESIAARVAALAGKLPADAYFLAGKLPADAYFLTGGLCDNAYVVERLAAALGAPVRTRPEARWAGAIGAALSA